MATRTTAASSAQRQIKFRPLPPYSVKLGHYRSLPSILLIVSALDSIEVRNQAACGRDFHIPVGLSVHVLCPLAVGSVVPEKR